MKKHKVKCPVDVYVYDSNGNLCGEIVDNRVNPDCNEIFMYVEEDAKYFYLTGDDYQVKLVGNDTGSMTYTVEECDGDMECLRALEYRDIPLADGKTYYSMSIEPVLADSSFYNLVSDTGEVIKADSDAYENGIEERVFVSDLKLNPASCRVTVGDRKYLSAEIEPRNASIQTVRWNSGNQSVVSVNEDGLITAKKEGSAVITAKSYDGSLEASCRVTVIPKQTKVNLSRAAGVSLNATSYTYNGKPRQPEVTVKHGSKRLVRNKDYVISYKNNTNIGTASVTITGIGTYTGSVTKTFEIVPKGTVLSGKPKAGSKSFTARWKKQKKDITGYQIQYSTSKKFTKKTTVIKTVKKKSATKLTVRKLKANKRYYVRIRTYQTVSTKKYCSAWSKSKIVKTKR